MFHSISLNFSPWHFHLFHFIPWFLISFSIMKWKFNLDISFNCISLFLISFHLISFPSFKFHFIWLNSLISFSFLEWKFIHERKCPDCYVTLNFIPWSFISLDSLIFYFISFQEMQFHFRKRNPEIPFHLISFLLISFREVPFDLI